MRPFSSVDQYGERTIPMWRFKLWKRWHNLLCNECRPVYRFWSLQPKRDVTTGNPLNSH